ncbi:S8 family serine peptidase [Fluviispira vulneris]|uniref:S8 family serine peptidase n=1 Tax=Fluviispira vulneris TaxID=2763012 RepID=UPI0016473150|nr:S8 family serine peptidase [Fluviispira vulneris]
MGLYKNCTALLSVSVVSISFLSSCGKGSNQSELQFANKSEALDVENNISELKASKFCTDLDNEKLNPLAKYQWHLKNTGQKAFASNPGVSGEDINVASVLKEDCLSGYGVNVAVVDTGLEIKHRSLKDNVERNDRVNQELPTSLNFRENRLQKNDPSPIAQDKDDHGTMVAGIIGMRSNLGYGGSGVAPRAFLTGYNIIQAEDNVQTFQNFVDSLGGSDESNKNHIFSMSYGDNNISQISADDFVTNGSLTAYRYGVKNLRDGKGALYVKAAGNGFYKLGNEEPYISACKTALELNVSCQNSNMNTDNSLPEVITVGALNAKGIKTSYSTTGSSLWISAPGGEFGFDKEWISEQFTRLGTAFDWANKRATAGDPAIVTTDMSGSASGMSKRINFNTAEEIFDIRNTFNAGLVEGNESYDYTNTMNGTSSATPVTSGSIALILEANPKLTWRDVKYILAKTATKVDPYFEGVKVKLADGEYQAEQGWVNNAAGFHFSNYYGFGRVNVADAVKLAKKYKLGSLGQYVEIPRESALKTIGFNTEIKQGVQNSYTVSLPAVKSSQNLTLESVRLFVSIDSSYIGDVGIELTSPSGTKSIIWNIGNAFSNKGNLKNMPIQSNAFYGENSKGVWKVKIINSGLHSANVKLKGLGIQFAGQKTKA